MEKAKISGVAKDADIARIALVGLRNEPGIAFKIFREMSKANVNVDIILQSIGRGRDHSETKDISFTIQQGDMERAVEVLEKEKAALGYTELSVTDKVAKVSIVGAGMMTASGVAATMFEALYDAGVNISMISTSEIKVSVLVDKNDADRAVSAIHAKFFEN